MKSHITGFLSVLCVLSFLPGALSSDTDMYKVQREEVFDFAQKPVVSRNGDVITVAFETKGFCDVAVAVEDANGKMLRHVVSGVLGPNAPDPLQKNSKKQVVVWDGKNDAGEYVDNKDGCTLRVSLGLKPQFERNLLFSPYKRWGRHSSVVAAGPEGVYVFEGDNVDSIKLYDHEATYLRTIYPFPADKIGQVKGLRWHAAPQDGAKVPFKEGFYQSTFLNSGFNSGYDAASGYGVTHYPTIGMGWAEDAPDFAAATSIAVNNGRLAVVGPLGVNRMATDGTSGGAEFVGPRLKLEARGRGVAGANPPSTGARSTALSPDGKWLYLTGYCWRDDSRYSTAFGGGHRWLHGVLRLKYDEPGAPAVFVGAGVSSEEPGNAPDKLNSPTAVACDSQGNVYVADCGNNRIQVFSPDARLIESIPFERPTALGVHQKSGELYVCTWPIRVWAPEIKTAATLTRLGPAGQRDKLATCKLPLELGNSFGDTTAGGMQYRATLDSWAEPPAIWLVTGAPVMAHTGYEIHNTSWSRGALKVFTVDGDKLVLRKDFGAETQTAVPRQNALTNARQLFAVNPRTGKVYVMEREPNQALEIDPETGMTRLKALPHAADDIAFDMDGYIYLNAGSCVTRFDPGDLREVPWDYGEERKGVGGGSHGEKSVDALAALILPGSRPPIDEKSHTCGFALSPRGLMALYCWNGEKAGEKPATPGEKIVGESGRSYVPPVYPGRQRWGEIHVWNRAGNVLHTDAIPGLGFTDGVAIDKDENLYVLSGAARTPNGTSRFNPRTCTLMKFKPGKGRIVTSGDKRVPVALKPGEEPKEPSPLAGRWVTGAEWLYGGVGYSGWEWSSRFALDLYARSFVPETDRFTVAVLDTNGNLILRIGKYGNVDDGKPLIPDPSIPAPHSIGGDEVSLMHACYTGVQSDKRLFISDAGNRRIASVKLGYATEEKLSLKNVPDQADKKQAGDER